MAIITSKNLHRISFTKWPAFIRKPFTLWFIKRKKLNSLPFETKLNDFRFEGDAANLIDYHVLSRGAFEPGLTELLKLWGTASGNNTLLLDVGTNVGVHSLGACRHFEQVISVEPYPPLIERLKNHIKINQIQNIKLIEGGLASTNSEADFIAPERGNLGTGRVVQNNPSAKKSATAKIQLYSGDSLLEESESKLAAIKIDVEGFELDVLSGLSKSLQKFRPLVVCELLTNADEHLSKFKALLPQHDSFYSLDRIKRKKFALSKWGESAGDIVACPNEKTDILSEFITG